VAFPVYTIEVLAKNETGSSSEVYTVPGGMRLVVRDISGVVINGTTGSTDIFVAGDHINFATWSFPAGMTKGFHWEGRCVAGSELDVQTDGHSDSFWFYRITGYLLTLP
jgi:hypothetical protein